MINYDELKISKIEISLPKDSSMEDTSVSSPDVSEDLSGSSESPVSDVEITMDKVPLEEDVYYSSVESSDGSVSSIMALDKPLADYSVTEFLLLLIFCLLCVNTLLKLFIREWGFFRW